VDFADLDHTTEVVWMDIDIVKLCQEHPEGSEFAASSLHSELNPHCHSQLQLDMLLDLLSCGDRAETRRYLDGQVRLVRTFCVQPDELDGNDGDQEFQRGNSLRVLVFQPVTVLAGDGWVITCWHRRRTYEGARRIPGYGHPDHHEHIFFSAGDRWARRGLKSAGDLGVLIMEELALSYAPAHRKLYDWLETWELTLYLNQDEPGQRKVIDRTTLPDLWGAMATLRDWLNPLNVPGMRADIDRAWFAGCTDHQLVIQVDDRIDTSLRNLRELGATLRSSFSLLHLQLAEDQRERGERLQRTIEFLGAAFLLPTIVVGFYGANTKLPGQGTWWGFWVMVGAMLLLGGGCLVSLRLLRARDTAQLRAAEDHRGRLRAGLARNLERPDP
jgi:hypothetical protein